MTTIELFSQPQQNAKAWSKDQAFFMAASKIVRGANKLTAVSAAEIAIDQCHTAVLEDSAPTLKIPQPNAV